MNTITVAGAMSGLEDLLAQMSAGNESAEQVGESTEDAVAEPTGETVAVDQPETGEGAETVAVAPVVKGKKKADKKPKPPKAQKPPKVVKTKEVPVSAIVPEGADADPTKVVAPKPPVEKRIFFGRNKLGRLENKLGNDFGKRMVLSIRDTELSDDEIAAKISSNKEAFRDLAVKVQNRATNLIEFVSGKSKRLNPVIEIAVRMLSRERVLVTGDKGNLQTKLQTLYTEGAARAMGNSTMGALRALGIVIPGTEKQTYVANEDSTILALLSNAMLLSFVDIEGILSDVVSEENKQIAEQAAAAEAATAAVPTPDTAAVVALVESVSTESLEAQLKEVEALDTAVF